MEKFLFTNSICSTSRKFQKKCTYLSIEARQANLLFCLCADGSLAAHILYDRRFQCALISFLRFSFDRRNQLYFHCCGPAFFLFHFESRLWAAAIFYIFLYLGSNSEINSTMKLFKQWSYLCHLSFKNTKDDFRESLSPLTSSLKSKKTLYRQVDQSKTCGSGSFQSYNVYS